MASGLSAATAPIFPVPTISAASPSSSSRHGEWHVLVLDERHCVALAAGADGRDLGTGCEKFVVSVADLTGPLTAGQSTKVPKEQKHLGMVLPQVTEALWRAIRIDEHFVCELCCVEWHACLPGVS